MFVPVSSHCCQQVIRILDFALTHFPSEIFNHDSAKIVDFFSFIFNLLIFCFFATLLIAPFSNKTEIMPSMCDYN